jgi:hypothetical protein
MLWKRTSRPGCHGVIIPYALIGTIADQPGYQVLRSAPSSVLTASLAEPLGSSVVTIPIKNRHFFTTYCWGNKIKENMTEEQIICMGK